MIASMGKGGRKPAVMRRSVPDSLGVGVRNAPWEPETKPEPEVGSGSLKFRPVMATSNRQGPRVIERETKEIYAEGNDRVPRETTEIRAQGG